MFSIVYYILILLIVRHSYQIATLKYTSYRKNYFLSGFYHQSVVKDSILCILSCIFDEDCLGVNYYKSGRKCYLYDRIPSCYISEPNIGMNILLPQGSFDQNIALNKPTNMSSVRDIDQGPCRAVDGDFTNIIHTHASFLEWWCVDLEKVYIFKSIVLYNRDNKWPGPVGRIIGFELRLTDTGQCDLETYEGTILCYKDTESQASKVYNITSCNQLNIGFSSRFIFISPKPNSILNFRELTVHELSLNP